jgi:Nif-specific ferredoxin III
MPETHLTRDGREWTPYYLESIDDEECIGCGRCYKVCAQDVLKMRGVNDEGEIVDIDEDDDAERMIMTIADKGNCIGCRACERVCSKKAMSYVTA